MITQRSCPLFWVITMTCQGLHNVIVFIFGTIFVYTATMYWASRTLDTLLTRIALPTKQKTYWYNFSTLSMFILKFYQLSNILMTITIPLHNRIRPVFDISHAYYRVGHILEFYMDLNCSSGPHPSNLLYRLFHQKHYKYIALATINKSKFIICEGFEYGDILKIW